MRIPVLLLACAGLVLTGCAAPSDTDVRRAVRAYSSALSAHDGAAVCRLLSREAAHEVASSTGKPCAEGVLEESLPPPGSLRRVEVWSVQAQVRGSEDTLFLSHFPDGWKVTAAGCHARPGKPYDCEVSS